MFRRLDGYACFLGKRGKLSRGVWGVIFERGVREGTAKRKNSDLNVDHCRGYKMGQVARRLNRNKKKACPLAVEIIQVRVSMLTENKRPLSKLVSTLVEAEKVLVEAIARMTEEYRKLNRRWCKKPNGNTWEGKPVSALAVGITGTRLPETKYRTVTIKNKQGATEC
ncbi:hypothetical protein [Xenorhabdus bovienii]|uniref:Uncharacterized protein n=2 Tax=Xenorhabdus bovienii TaxID=40576 RepID=A0A077QD29_XENBV|nr:hypothetical protein [Xenorhabdus bovienii]MDE9484182.1 hypothetical protein [Xenorhabdus bovienii]CDH34037.1 conserved hypothetical protein [Xenorhabdus bovienii str. Intermedium]